MIKNFYKLLILFFSLNLCASNMLSSDINHKSINNFLVTQKRRLNGFHLTINESNDHLVKAAERISKIMKSYFDQWENDPIAYEFDDFQEIIAIDANEDNQVYNKVYLDFIDRLDQLPVAIIFNEEEQVSEKNHFTPIKRFHKNDLSYIFNAHEITLPISYQKIIPSYVKDGLNAFVYPEADFQVTIKIPFTFKPTAKFLNNSEIDHWKIISLPEPNSKIITDENKQVIEIWNDQVLVCWAVEDNSNKNHRIDVLSENTDWTQNIKVHKNFIWTFLNSNNKNFPKYTKYDIKFITNEKNLQSYICNVGNFFPQLNISDIEPEKSPKPEFIIGVNDLAFATGIVYCQIKPTIRNFDDNFKYFYQEVNEQLLPINDDTPLTLTEDTDLEIKSEEAHKIYCLSWEEVDNPMNQGILTHLIVYSEDSPPKFKFTSLNGDEEKCIKFKKFLTETTALNLNNFENWSLSQQNYWYLRYLRSLFTERYFNIDNKKLIISESPWKLIIKPQSEILVNNWNIIFLTFSIIILIGVSMIIYTIINLRKIR